MRKNHEHDEEVARQLERDADDDAMWEQEPVNIERRPSRTSVLSLRLPTAEFHTLLRAAREAGESVSDYVRKAIAARMANQPPTTSITASYADFVMPRDSALIQYRTLTAGTVQSDREAVTFTR